MSMYGEPDLADLLPAHYCNYLARQRQNCPSVWKVILSHLLAMVIAIGLCGSGYYYYQFVYIPKQQEHFSMNKGSIKTEIKDQRKIINHEEFKSAQTSSVHGPGENCKKDINFLRDEITTIHDWRSAINTIITKMQWEQDLKITAAIENALEEYEADGIAIMDYAAAYAGGTIYQLTKDTRPHPTHRPLSLFRIVSVDVLSSPEELIRPCVFPGSCFAFRGDHGSIQIKLGKPIRVGGITLSHGSRLLLGAEGMNSAPKDFEVHGFTDEDDDSGTLLGKFTYDWLGKQHQTFRIDKNQIFELVELTILSNYGKEEFTCVYRFRVHKKELESTDKASQANISKKKKNKCC